MKGLEPSTSRVRFSAPTNDSVSLAAAAFPGVSSCASATSTAGRKQCGGGHGEARSADFTGVALGLGAGRHFDVVFEFLHGTP